MIVQALISTWHILERFVPIIFFSLFGMEVLIQLGALRKLEPLGRPLGRLAHLPPQSAATFLASIGSVTAANTMTADLRDRGIIDSRQMVLTAFLNSIPAYIKEALAYHFPVVLPLLGVRLCLIYLSIFWLAGITKLGVTIVAGRMLLPAPGPVAQENPGPAVNKTREPFGLIIVNAFHARKKLFFRMITILAIVMFTVNMLVSAGALGSVESLVGPMMAKIDMPGAVIAPVTAYVLSPTVGLTMMSGLLQERIVTEFQAIVSLLVGGFLMVPIFGLRSTLPRYTAIFGFRFGVLIVGTTTAIALVTRAMILVAVLFFC